MDKKVLHTALAVRSEIPDIPSNNRQGRRALKTTSTQRNQKRRDEAKKKGLVRYGDQYITPEHKEQIKRFAKKLTGGEK